MKRNYLAWNIKFDDFLKNPSGSERLKFLIQFAVLAPSSHNIQPWKFKVTNDSIAIKPNMDRVLPVSDPESRHMYIALGCALENILVAADYYGFKTTAQYLPPEQKDTAVIISFSPGPELTRAQGHLIFSIPTRRSNRAPHTEEMPPQNILEKIKSLSTSEMEVSIVTDQQQKEKIADILMQTRFEEFANVPFRSEMANYKRNNFTTSYFGMPGFTQGIGNAFSLIAPFLIRHFNIMKKLGPMEAELLKKRTSVYLFVNAKEHTPLGWLKTGQVLQKIMLQAEHNGLQTAPSALPSDISPIQKILKTSFRPEMFLRLGKAIITPPHTPRLQASATIET